MCDPGEMVSVTLKREFMEEATNTTVKNDEEKEKIKKELDSIFSKGIEVDNNTINNHLT
jgi:hypothetical protein